MTLHDDPVTKWTFECPTNADGTPPPGGLVLRDIRHDGHNFAREVRVIGVWVTLRQDSTGSVSIDRRFLVLGDGPLKGSPTRTLKPERVTWLIKYRKIGHGDYVPIHRTFDYLAEADRALNFAQYFRSGHNYIAYGVASRYEAPTLFNDLGYANCEFAGVTFEQLFLLSPYGNEPRHEPTGGLSAARFHPLLRYELIPNAGFDRRKDGWTVVSIRFDFRLHLCLDRHHDLLENARLKQLGNQAGLFADKDSFASAALTTIVHGGTRKAISKAGFEAVEKPLVLEVTAPALVKGTPNADVLSPRDSAFTSIGRCWDNIHWWGARGPDESLPTTPGAFHCAHIHWRWSGATPSTTQFDPRTWPDSFAVVKSYYDYGPLVDPAIFLQTLWLAVTRAAEPKLDPARQKLRDLSMPEWQKLFDPGLGRKPMRIKEGEDIVLWYSTEVFSHVILVDGTQVPAADTRGETPFPRAGTLFIHGIFFAHDAEPDHWYEWFTHVNPFNPNIRGTAAELYWPWSEDNVVHEQVWSRSASGWH